MHTTTLIIIGIGSLTLLAVMWFWVLADAADDVETDTAALRNELAKVRVKFRDDTEILWDENIALRMDLSALRYEFDELRKEVKTLRQDVKFLRAQKSVESAAPVAPPDPAPPLPSTLTFEETRALLFEQRNAMLDIAYPDRSVPARQGDAPPAWDPMSAVPPPITDNDPNIPETYDMSNDALTALRSGAIVSEGMAGDPVPNAFLPSQPAPITGDWTAYPDDNVTGGLPLTLGDPNETGM